MKNEEMELLLRLERSLRREQYATHAEIEDVIDEQVLVLSLLDDLRARAVLSPAELQDVLTSASHDARIQAAQDNMIDALWQKEKCGEQCLEWKP